MQRLLLKSIPLFKRTLHGKNFIGNSLSSLGVSKTSPRNNNATVMEATDEEIDLACKLAEKAFVAYRKEPTERIVQFLDQIYKNLAKREEPILIMAMNETGLPRARLAGEFARTLWQVKSYTDAIKDGSFAEARIFDVPSKPDLRRMLVPLGPIAVFGASNFPLAYSVLGGDTVSALVTKNPVIVKAHVAHIGTCELVAEVVQDSAKEVGMPDGVFSMLHGEETVGSKLVSHPAVRGVGFTGSIGGGRAIFDIANKRPFPIPVYAELGSVNPVIVLPNALETRGKDIAQKYVDSFTASCGQFCTNPGILFLVGKNTNEFFESLVTHLKTIPPHRMLTNGIYKSFQTGLKSFLNHSEIVYQNPTQEDKIGAVSLKTTVKSFISNHKILSQEVFGPLSLIVQCETMDELKEAYSLIEGQLSSTIHATEKDFSTLPVQDLVDQLTYNVGRVVLNGFPTGLEVCSATHHGGPYPACTDIRTGAVGPTALSRWVRPVTYQNFKSAQHLVPGRIRDIPTDHVSIREENGEWKLK